MRNKTIFKEFKLPCSNGMNWALGIYILKPINLYSY